MFKMFKIRAPKTKPSKTGAPKVKTSKIEAPKVKTSKIGTPKIKKPKLKVPPLEILAVTLAVVATLLALTSLLLLEGKEPVKAIDVCRQAAADCALQLPDYPGCSACDVVCLSPITGEELYEGVIACCKEGRPADIYENSSISCGEIVPPGCVPTEDTETICNDNIDNDCDNLIDSADSDCQQSSCVPTETTEITCDDNIDNDCDGNADFTDDDCRDTENWPPVALFAADPTSGTASLNVSFNASASSDPDGTIDSYDWDFGDNSTATGEATQHTFTSTGNYTVTLTVIDDDGATDNETEEIIVSGTTGNQVPIASFTANSTSGTAPLTVSFDASASSDPDGTITNYSWDFGDTNSGTGETIQHTFTSAGNYTVTLTVTDNSSATDDTTTQISVSEEEITVTGYATGSSGDMRKTTNGGDTWTAQTSGTSNDLYKVFFVDSNTGWAAGTDGIIINTSNGGNSWSSQTSSTPETLHDVFFVDANTGWAVGLSGVIVKTTNGGDTWAEQTSGTTNNLLSVHFADANTGWAVGASGEIRKTTNGGDNWLQRNSGTSEDLYGVYFADSSVGYIVSSSGSVLKSIDAGQSWNQQTITVSALEDVFFTGTNTGWVVGDSGEIYKTTDGSTWIEQDSGTTVALYDLYFTNSSTGWIVGSSGTVLKTINGGTTWTDQTSGTSNALYGVSFIS